MIARYVIHAGRELEVIELLRQLAAQTLREPGVLAFTIHRELDEPRRLTLLASPYPRFL